MSEGLAGVSLAAGRGERLRPLTDIRPKPLCPINNQPLVDLAIERLAPAVGVVSPETVAVNTHHWPDQMRAHLAGRVWVSEEQPEALGTAGALGALRDWIDGRDVVVTNADAYLPGGLDRLTEGWDGQRIRLLVKEIGSPADFGTMRYVGACLLPWTDVAGLASTPSGLYEVLWRSAYQRGELDFAVIDDVAIDCGSPADYLAANLHASGGASVVGEGARVEGELVRSVVWPGAGVRPGEVLADSIRAGTPDRPLTVWAG